MSVPASREKSYTARPRFLLGLLAVLALVTLGALVGGAGWMTVVPLSFTLLVGWLCRQVLRLDDQGIRYKSMLPWEDFHMRWGDVSQVVIDIVSTHSPGEPGNPVARVRFLSRNAPARTAMLFSEANASPVARACRARGLDVVLPN